MFACLTLHAQTGHVVTTSFYGKVQKLLFKFKGGRIFPNLYCIAYLWTSRIWGWPKKKKKNAEKELNYHTVKELLYK